MKSSAVLRYSSSTFCWSGAGEGRKMTERTRL
jgi:hypothetical protein